jgi:hypothetical protein
MPVQIRNKSYGYTLFTNEGEKIRGHISAPNEEVAERTLKGMQNAREDVQFFTLDSLDYPADYTWDEKLKMWQGCLL